VGKTRGRISKRPPRIGIVGKQVVTSNKKVNRKHRPRSCWLAAHRGRRPSRDDSERGQVTGQTKQGKRYCVKKNFKVSGELTI